MQTSWIKGNSPSFRLINLLFLFIAPQFLYSQINNLDIFENLMGRDWKAEGKWGDGSTFQQEISFQYSLDSTIIITNSTGFLDEERKLQGQRNHGIRKFDKALNEIQFWEFDIFGGTTKGVVKAEGKNILYQYQYGESFVSEVWEYLNDSTYNFKVGNYNDGEWSQIYLNTQFKTTEISNIEKIYSTLKNNLKGNWTSAAWDGALNENWDIDKNGHIIQSAQYIENQEVLYKAENKMELVNNELILFTIIKGANPKIFKASHYTSDKIVFENTDYKNPNKVIYSFAKKDEFNRTISGQENGEPSSYTFKFKRIKK